MHRGFILRRPQLKSEYTEWLKNSASKLVVSHKEIVKFYELSRNLVIGKVTQPPNKTLHYIYISSIRIVGRVPTHSIPEYFLPLQTYICASFNTYLLPLIGVTYSRYRTSTSILTPIINASLFFFIAIFCIFSSRFFHFFVYWDSLSIEILCLLICLSRVLSFYTSLSVPFLIPPSPPSCRIWAWYVWMWGRV